MLPNSFDQKSSRAAEFLLAQTRAGRVQWTVERSDNTHFGVFRTTWLGRNVEVEYRTGPSRNKAHESLRLLVEGEWCLLNPTAGILGELIALLQRHELEQLLDEAVLSAQARNVDLHSVSAR